MDGDLRAFLAEMLRRKVNNEAKTIFHKLRHPPGSFVGHRLCHRRVAQALDLAGIGDAAGAPLLRSL
jgi:hypothetical protein